jgi:hypothetical protein
MGTEVVRVKILNPSNLELKLKYLNYMQQFSYRKIEEALKNTASSKLVNLLYR